MAKTAEYVLSAESTCCICTAAHLQMPSTNGATEVALSEVFGLLGLIIPFEGLLVTSPLSVALKCARHRSSELLMSVNRLPS